MAEKELNEQGLGKKLIKYMSSKQYEIQAINIVYLEAANADTWEPVKNVMDAWDDVRILVRNTGEVILSCEATTEPGAYYTYNRMYPGGAFRIAIGQHKDAWEIGKHYNQDALRQCGVIVGFRDNNEDGLRLGDATMSGDWFSVNQHTTGDKGSNNYPPAIGRWSAGCLVGRYAKTHYERFMPTVVGMGKQRYTSTIIEGSALKGFVA